MRKKSLNLTALINYLCNIRKLECLLGFKINKWINKTTDRLLSLSIGASWDLHSYSFPCGCLQLSVLTMCSLANFPTGCEIDCEQKNVRWTEHAVCESAEHAFGWWSFCFGRTTCVCLSLKPMAQSQTKAPYIAQFATSNECIYLMCGTGQQIIYTSRFL